jgi:hypothetical protein
MSNGRMNDAVASEMPRLCRAQQLAWARARHGGSVLDVTSPPGGKEMTR